MSLKPSTQNQVDVPEMPSGVLQLEPPPDQPEGGGAGSILANLIPMMGSMGVMVFMAMSDGSNIRMLLMAGGMVFAMLAMVGFNIHRQMSSHRRKVSDARREYLAYLSETRDAVRQAEARQRRHLTWKLPDPRSLVLIADEGSRLWERSTSDESALFMRLGTSSQALALTLIEPEVATLADPDPVCASALHQFAATHSFVDSVPFGVSLDHLSHIEVCGPYEPCLAQMRAMICHLATLTSPDTLRIAVLCSEDRRAHWEWLKWLPHARSEHVSDALGPARMIASDAYELQDLLSQDFPARGSFRNRSASTPWPHILVITDGMEPPANSRLGAIEGTAGVTLMAHQESWSGLPAKSVLRLSLSEHPNANSRHDIDVVVQGTEPVVGVADDMTIEQAEAVARRMTKWVSAEKPSQAGGNKAASGKSDPKRAELLTTLLGMGDIRDFDPETMWKYRTGRDRLNVPFAVTPEGAPVAIDIKEAAQFGMGPHGLLIGATGSGKSEVLRTLCLALALTHSPEQLNFVLVDFKGGATFAGMSDLPHVSAMISNLEAELSLVDRMQDALRGEMVRRQEVLRLAGNYANVSDYEDARRAGKHSQPPLPALFIIVDEFSEMLTAKPEFIDIFVAIGRLGRSLSIHILLATQRVEEGRLRGLESHLSYRIGLRTFSANESRAVLGVADAYTLPSIPGVGYLKAGSDELVQFRASYVASAPPARKAQPGQSQAGSVAASIELRPFTSLPQILLEAPKVDEPKPSQTVVLPGDEQWADKSQIDIAVAKMKGHGLPAHQVWLPPLEVPETFDSMMSDLAVDPQLGLVSLQWRNQGRLRIPLGIVDLPLEQRREFLVVDLAGAGGHFATVGSPLTGKSTVLRSLVMGLSLTHTPREVTFYIMDFGGGGFAPFEGAAHVAGVATRDTPDVVDRMMAEVESIIDDREKYFRSHRIDSMTTYRDRRAQGEVDDGYGDVFLVVDGWSSVRTDFDVIEQRIQQLAARALTFGLHFLLASGRWMDFRQQLKDVIGSRLELRLGDVTDSEHGRAISTTVPENRPGRGLSEKGHHMLIALPRCDADPNPETLGAGMVTSLTAIADSWPGATGPKLRLLPEMIELSALQEQAGPDYADIILGVEESRLGVWGLNPRTDSHLFVFGDSKSGKTSFMRSMLADIQRTHTTKQAQFMLIDFRRSLLGEVSEEYLAGYCATREDANEKMGGLAQFLQTRLPGDDVTPEQLRNRSWWTGSEVWVFVDDYEFVSTNSGNPLLPLQPLMAQAQDVGLHIVVSRRMGGASRAMYDSIIQTMTETGTTGIMLSGNPDEGAVIGRVKPMKTAPGRAQVVTRDGRMMAQLAWSPPTS